MEMSGCKKFLAMGFLTTGLALLMALPVAAQDNAAEAAERARAAEQRAIAIEARSAQRAEAMEVQMREAEERLAEAAARVAELSSSRLPQVVRAGRLQGSMHPVMGITIGADDGDGPVEGVVVSGVSPGSAAADAGLRAGDVITAVNDESLSADAAEDANRKLLDFMDGIVEGDALDVEYLRDGRAATVEVRPRVMPLQTFAFRSGNQAFGFPGAPGAPGAPGMPIAPGAAPFFSVFMGGGSWGDMEMVSLTEDLGRYFGTDEGLLVVRAPDDDNLKLRDGDVIQSIDGREPTSVSHAMRILGSYQGGETLEIEIMRDRKRQTVSVEMPDNRQSAAGAVRFSLPATIESGAIEIVESE
jgi:membrane-associated protease RseP (regulator of RpoE activity)